MCFTAKNTRLKLALKPITCYKLVYFTFDKAGMQSSTMFFPYVFDKTYFAFNWKRLKHWLRFIHFLLGWNGHKKNKYFLNSETHLEIGFHSHRILNDKVALSLHIYAGVPSLHTLQHALVKCTIPVGALYRYQPAHNELLSTHIRIDALYARILNIPVDGKYSEKDRVTITHRPQSRMGITLRGECKDFNTLPGPERLEYVAWMEKSVSS